MKYRLALLILLLPIHYCFADPDFAGTYKCKGFDPYLNRPYSGKITITPQNTVYRLVMDYDSDTDNYNGTAGLYDEHSLAVVFQSEKNLKKVGLERYAYSDDKKHIQGYWVYLGKDKLGSEVCEKE